MIGKDLEQQLHVIYTRAEAERLQHIDVEHLLLGILDDATVAKVLCACTVNIDSLRTRLTDHTKKTIPRITGQEVEPKPTLGFQHVIQRASMRVQANCGLNDENMVKSEDVLLALFGEKDSPAVGFLHQEGVARVDVHHYMANTLKKNKKSSDFQKFLDMEKVDRVHNFQFTSLALRELLRAQERGDLTLNQLVVFFERGKRRGGN